ncbi:MAG: PEP-CTERM sorting domain-containing protein [Verrucomicrobiota bacterium]
MSNHSNSGSGTTARPMSKMWLAVALVAAQALNLHADVTLSDLNSTAKLDALSQSGMYQWTVDGQNQLNQQWFWYRIGNTAEASINTISTPTISTYNGTRGVTTTYANGQFSIQIDYLLTGGTAGSGTADIGESIRIINTSGSQLDFHFFQYSDFDLAGTPNDDSVALTPISGKYYISDQVQGASVVETVTTPPATRGEAALYSFTKDKLNDGVASDLNNMNTAGPGDATWALQWDLSIAPDGSVLISKDKRIQLALVPEPSTLALLGLGLAAFSIRKKRKLA